VPFEIPDSWEWVRLDELAQYKKGPFGSSLTKAMFVPKGDNTFKVYEQKNAIQKDECLGNYYISESHFEQLKGFEVFPHDIIVSCAGTIGETYVLPQNIQRGIINQALMYIRLYCAEITDFYLIYFDSIIKGNSQNDSKGTAIKNIPPFEVLKKYLFPLPPLAEQKRIIAEVQKWFSFVDDIDANKADLFRYVQQTKSKVLSLAIHGKLVPQDPNEEPAIQLLKRINPHFIPCDTSHYENLPFEIPQNWVWVRGKDIFDAMQSTKPQGEFFEYIDIDAIDNKRNLIVAPKHIECSNAPSRATRLVAKGDVLFSMVRPYLRNIALVDKDDYIASTGFFVCKPNLAITSDYCFYLMTSDYVVNGLNQYMKGDNSPSINNQHILNWLYPIPPLLEQKRIVAALKKVFSQLDTITAEL